MGCSLERLAHRRSQQKREGGRRKNLAAAQPNDDQPCFVVDPALGANGG
jgi:hypothetical protein